MKAIIKKCEYETVSMAELWALIGRTTGASEKQVADLVQRMMSCIEDENKEKNENDIESK